MKAVKIDRENCKVIFFCNLAVKAPFGLIFYELRAKRRAESEFDSFRPCFVDKTWIFRNSTGKRPLELIIGEFFTARRAEYEFDIFTPFSDFSGSFVCGFFSLFCQFVRVSGEN